MAYEQELGSADRYYDAIKSYRRMNAAKTKIGERSDPAAQARAQEWIHDDLRS
jgi:hypothetical protein